MTAVDDASQPATLPAWMKWLGVVWICIWVPSYAVAYPLGNFLQLCDVAMFLTVVAIFRGSALLMSAQALAVLMIDALWTLDFLGRVFAGRHPIRLTEYMFDEKYPLFIRFLSLFHIWWPILILVALRRIGYDRRALWLQSGIAAVVFLFSRLLAFGHNYNYVLYDPIYYKTYGPPWVHVPFMWLCAVGIAFVPAHVAMCIVYRGPRTSVPEPAPEEVFAEQAR